MSEPFKEVHLKGLPISRGVANAFACLLSEPRHATGPAEKISPDAIPHEQELLREALQTVGMNLTRLIDQVSERVGPAEAGIFSALKTMIDDKGLQKRLLEAIEKTRCTAEVAVATTFDAYALRMQSAKNAYIKERATDIRDLKAHLLDALRKTSRMFRCDGVHYCQHGKNRVVIAPEMTPSLAVKLDLKETRGFLTEHGGETSHAAILARSLGVPAVSGVPNIYNTISCGTELLINGATGDVYIWPSVETKARIAREMPSIIEHQDHQPVAGFKVLANISSAHEVDDALKLHAEGIGLYRTEFEFIAAGRILDEDAQYERYARVVKKLNGMTAYFRLLDIGGDKPFQFMNVPKETNPYLGCRGARYLLAHPELLRAQARALARASELGVISVLYPMITGIDQFQLMKKMFDDAIMGLPRGTLLHGVLFEVPSACLEAAEIFALADFGSVGTNDLIQYLFAVDRGNDLVAGDYSPDRPVLWSLLRTLVVAADAAGKQLSVCGEIAGDPQFTPRLIECGVRMISTNARSIAQVRDMARKVMQSAKGATARVV